MPDGIEDPLSFVCGLCEKGYESNDECAGAWHDPAEMGSYLSGEA